MYGLIEYNGSCEALVAHYQPQKERADAYLGADAPILVENEAKDDEKLPHDLDELHGPVELSPGYRGLKVPASVYETLNHEEGHVDDQGYCRGHHKRLVVEFTALNILQDVDIIWVLHAQVPLEYDCEHGDLEYVEVGADDQSEELERHSGAILEVFLLLCPVEGFSQGIHGDQDGVKSADENRIEHVEIRLRVTDQGVQLEVDEFKLLVEPHHVGGGVIEIVEA